MVLQNKMVVIGQIIAEFESVYIIVIHFENPRTNLNVVVLLQLKWERSRWILKFPDGFTNWWQF